MNARKLILALPVGFIAISAFDYKGAIMTENEIIAKACEALSRIEKTPPLEVRAARPGQVAAVKDDPGRSVTVFRRMADHRIVLERWPGDVAQFWKVERFELPAHLQARAAKLLDSL